MAVDTPATIAILGAGPVGLETALYARFLGYDVKVFERGEVAENVRAWGHVRMFTPLAMNTSPLGRAALAAQDENFSLPDDSTVLTGAEWAERYLLPLSQTDLLADCICTHTTVLAVSRWGARKATHLGRPERTDTDFRLLVADRTGVERSETAEVVIDTTGVYSSPNWLGPGGAPAIGERQLRARRAIEYGLPDVLGRDRAHYEGRRVLLAGSGHSAATTLAAFEQLTQEAPGTEIVWITPYGANPKQPLVTIADDRIAERRRLVDRANQLAASSQPPIVHRPGLVITAIELEGDRFSVRLMDIETEEEFSESFDRVVANIGYRPDWTLARELQLHVCYATEGPMALAASLLKQTSADCLDQTSTGPATLMNPEPNFYVLGAKSYGRNPHFLYSIGINQVRELFTVIGDRADLDLYAGARQLPR